LEARLEVAVKRAESGAPHALAATTAAVATAVPETKKSGTAGGLAAGPSIEPAVVAGPAPALPDDNAPWPVDETAEAAFRADAHLRGESVMPVSNVATAAGEETEPKGTLPPLEELVKRIPPEVREALEDLFRAKFVKVKRVPKQALKN